MRKINNKGFTLIELLATIVILGVLMIIAIPMVSQYIKQARQSAFIDTAKAYVEAARYAYFGDGLSCTGDLDYGTAATIYIKFDQLRVDKSKGNSPFNKKITTSQSYVRITSTASGEYTYYVAMKDDGGNGFTEKEESVLKRSDVTSVNSITQPDGTWCTKSGS